MLIPSRRGFVTGLVGLVAAPAIVKASSLMPVKAWGESVVSYGFDTDELNMAMHVIVNGRTFTVDHKTLFERGTVELGKLENGTRIDSVVLHNGGMGDLGVRVLAG
jgi:hypothetical protein